MQPHGTTAFEVSKKEIYGILNGKRIVNYLEFQAMVSHLEGFLGVKTEECISLWELAQPNSVVFQMI